jgi:predicted transcriptional regulator
VLTRRAIGVLKAEELSTTQYNVLRILRRSAQGLTCGEIASRMITRDPDITRLVDRMEKRGLISRARENGEPSSFVVGFRDRSATQSEMNDIKYSACYFTRAILLIRKNSICRP